MLTLNFYLTKVIIYLFEINLLNENSNHEITRIERLTDIN